MFVNYDIDNYKERKSCFKENKLIDINNETRDQGSTNINIQFFFLNLFQQSLLHKLNFTFLVFFTDLINNFTKQESYDIILPKAL